MLEAEMDEHLGYEKHSTAGNNSGNSRNGYNRKTIISDYGESEIVVPRDRNGDFEPRVLEKRQTRTNEIEQKIMAMYAKGMSLVVANFTLFAFFKSSLVSLLLLSPLKTLRVLPGAPLRGQFA